MKTLSKISVEQQFLLFALSLVAIRIFKFENIGSLFLVWNLFLAWLPLFFIQQISLFENRYWKYIVLGMTILFLPNAIYIFTDLFHLQKNLHAPLWYDTILILSYGILGFLYFTHTLRHILHFFKVNSVSENTLKFIQFSIIFLSSFGVYLGRYLRLNSWDLFFHPTRIIYKFNGAVEAGRLSEIIQVTIFFGIFITFLYQILEKKMRFS